MRVIVFLKFNLHVTYTGCVTYTPCIMCVQYIGGCSVHRGVFSTSGGYHEYIGGISYECGGIPRVHRGISYECGGYHEYIGGCSVHRRDTMSTSGGYHEYIGGIS